MTVQIIQGDCRKVMAGMEPASVDAIVCDPPYGLEFMGKEWDRLGACADKFMEATDEAGRTDYHGKGNAPFGGRGNRIRYGKTAKAAQEWHFLWAIEALRVAKPGCHLLAFGGTRTFHRLTCALEDAGWEIRDCVMWVYGSGFPKSLDASKAIHKAAGVKRELMEHRTDGCGNTQASMHKAEGFAASREREYDMTAPATEAAKTWAGWGTALKPAWEPIIVARKPLAGTVAQNVQQFGSGAINVDGCRIGTDDGTRDRPPASPTSVAYAQDQWTKDKANRKPFRPEGVGRWPANLIHDGSDQVLGLFPQAEGGAFSGHRNTSGYRGRLDQGATPHGFVPMGDNGSAARFFYCAKAARGERESSLLGGIACAKCAGLNTLTHLDEQGHEVNCIRNNHPTVKPIARRRITHSQRTA
jgi:site-specific DNA-methyltransferase (adenine-specific)